MRDCIEHGGHDSQQSLRDTKGHIGEFTVDADTRWKIKNYPDIESDQHNVEWFLVNLIVPRPTGRHCSTVEETTSGGRCLLDGRVPQRARRTIK